MQRRIAERLANLERQSLDQLRQDLARIDSELADLERLRDEIGLNIGRLYARRGLDLPMDVVSGISSGLTLRQEELLDRISELNQSRDLINDQLIGQLLEVKRWEIAGARAVQSRSRLEARLAQAALDEAALMGYRRS